MTLPTAPTPMTKDLHRATMLIYGAPKWGKSTLASKFPGALFLPTEPGLNHLSVFQAPPDGSGLKFWDNVDDPDHSFLAICREIFAGKHPFRTIIVDTIDNLYKLCEEHICKQYKVGYINDLAYGKGQGLVNSEFYRVLRGLSQLPYGLILVSHAQDEKIDTGGVVTEKTSPTLQKGARKPVFALVDMILYCTTEAFTDSEGKVSQRRVLKTKPGYRYEAGERTGFLPGTIEATYQAFEVAWREALAKRDAAEAAKVAGHAAILASAAQQASPNGGKAPVAAPATPATPAAATTAPAPTPSKSKAGSVAQPATTATA